MAAVYAAYYWVYVTGERAYLTGRNFRLLATMGDQVEATIQADQNVLRYQFKRERPENPSPQQALDAALKDPLTAEFTPILKHAKVIGAVNSSDRALQARFAEHDSQIMWTEKREAALGPQNVAPVRLELDDLLTPILAGELPTDIFNAVLLTTHDGRVIFQAGQPRLGILRLDSLELDAKTPGTLDFAALARSPKTADVRIAGRGYKLFVQACCARMISDDSKADGWVIVGLTEQDALTTAAGAVPFSIMTLLMALLLFAVISWPFLKLSFIGDAQRVKAQDVVLVGLGALLGIALVTVTVLHVYAYAHLEAVLDDQLQAFATSVQHRAQDEVRAAYAQLLHLESDVLPAATSDKAVEKNLAARYVGEPASPFASYPFFDLFAVVSRGGMQLKKLMFESFETPLVDVGGREYFQYWTSSRRAPAFLQPLVSWTTGTRQAVLSKPVNEHTKAAARARTTPEEPAVATLTIPMRALLDPVMAPGFGFAVLDRNGGVLFHSDPHHNLSENFFVESDGSRRLKALVSARQNEWLDITYWGDDHRAYVTPLVLRADDDSRIALVDEPWTLVTFYDKNLTRTITVEWLVIVVVLMVSYAAVYVVVCLAVLFLRPKYRAPWLWPDPTRPAAYLGAMPPLLVLAATFAVSIVVLAPSDLIAAAGVLPWMAWIVTYRALSPRRRGWTAAHAAGALLLACLAASVYWRVAGWRGLVVALIGCAVAWALAARPRDTTRALSLSLPVNVSYGLAAALFLLLIASLPAAASFKVGYDTVLDSFVKYGQLNLAVSHRAKRSREHDRIARRISDPAAATRVKALRAAVPTWWDGYDTFFFCTRIRGEQLDQFDACPPLDAAFASNTTTNDDLGTIREIVEESLPFYSESSVWFREMVHDRAADKAWSWASSTSSIVFRIDSTPPLELASVKPPLVGWPGRDRDALWNAALLLLLATAIAGAIFWVARFILHSVFVVDLIEPLWSSGASGGAAPGPRSPATTDPLDPTAAPPEDADVVVFGGGNVGGWRTMAWRFGTPGFANPDSFLEAESRDPVARRIWRELLGPNDRRRPAPDVRNLIFEVGERAEQHYREIWAACTPAEKLVLGQLAEEGLVNQKAKRTVRALMARGLVRRQPHFTLLNETFRQFVLAPEQQHEVATLEEQSSGAWDVMRLPLLIVLLASLAFFFVAQQELFKTILGAFTAAATLLPVVVKVATSFGERKSAA